MWLTSDDAAPLLALAQDAADTGASELTVQTTLRGGRPPSRAGRRRHGTRLRTAPGRRQIRPCCRVSLFLTLDGVEQATRPQLAARHAGRFYRRGRRRSPRPRLWPWVGRRCLRRSRSWCRGRRVRSRHRDLRRCQPLRLAGPGLSPAWPRRRRCRGGEAGRQDGPLGRPGPAHDGGSWDVRGRTRRVFSLDGMSPTWDDVRAWAALAPATGAKLSPAFPHGAVPDGSEAQWTCRRGEVLECAIWWGPLAAVPGRTAAVCRPGPDMMVQAVVTEADAARGRKPGRASRSPLPPILDRGLWEADRAVIRAGLTGATPGRELGGHG